MEWSQSMSCLPEVQGYSGIGRGRGADVAAPYNYGGNFKGLLVRCLNCNASRHRGGDPSMRISVRNAGRWFGPRSVGPRHSAFPLARTNGPRLCDCASENYRDLPDSEARALIARRESRKLEIPGSGSSSGHALRRPARCAQEHRRVTPPRRQAAITTALRGASAPCTAQRPAWHRSAIPQSHGSKKFNSRSAARQNAPRSCR
jgi:hypothetical protein